MPAGESGARAGENLGLPGGGTKVMTVALQAYTQALALMPGDAAALAGEARAREYQQTCAALVGEWDWVLGTTTIVNADGTMQNLSLLPNHGTWECTDPAHRRFTLHWVVGGWVDNLTLSGDGNTVDAVNQIGIRFQAWRKGTQKKARPTNPLYGR